MATLSLSQLNAIARAAVVVTGGITFSQNPYLTPEIFDGDIVDYSPGQSSSSLSAPVILLNGVSKGSAYTTSGDVGKTLMVTQVAGGSVTGQSAPVTVSLIPTFKSTGMLGGNIGASADYGRTPLFANAVFDGRGFGVVGSFAAGGIALDSNGWPTVACESVITEQYSQLDPGVYHCTIKSAGQACNVTVSSSSATITNVVKLGDGVTTTFDLTYTAGGNVFMYFSTGFTFLDIPRDGSSTTVGKSKFNAAALAYYSQFPVLRFMDFMITNLNTQVNWSDRTADLQNITAGFKNASDSHYSWELLIDLANALYAQSGSKFRKLWINLPGHASPAFASSLSSLFNTYAPTGAIATGAMIVIVEYGNEPWNSGAFPLYTDYAVLAGAEAKMVSNYGLAANTIASVVGNGTQCTVTLNVNLSTLPFTIIVGQSMLAGDQSGTFQANAPGGALATTVAPALVSAVTTNSFSYPSSATGTYSGGTFSALFNLASTLITYETTQLDACNVYKLSPKFMVRSVFQCQQAWKTARPNDRWVLNLQQYAGQSAFANFYAPDHFNYAAWLGGGNAASWLYGVSIAPYVSAVSGGNYQAGTKTVSNCNIAPAFQVGDSLCLIGAGASFVNLNTTVTSVNAATKTLTVADTIVTSNTYGTVYMTGTRVAGALAAMNISLNDTDGIIRGHVYQCRKYGVHPMAYECGPDAQGFPQAQVEILTAPALQPFCTALFDLWFKNGGEEICLYHVSPANYGDSAGQSSNGLYLAQTWSSSQSYTDVTSPKIAALINYATTRNYVNVYGAPGELTAAYAQNGNGSLLPSGMVIWYVGSNRYVDFSMVIPRARRWGLVVYGTDGAAGTVVHVYVDNVEVGTVTLPVGGSGYDANPVASACATIPVTLAAGQHNVSLKIPTGGTSPLILKVVPVKI